MSNLFNGIQNLLIHLCQVHQEVDIWRANPYWNLGGGSSEPIVRFDNTSNLNSDIFDRYVRS